ncbi:Uncharacterised protein [Listeria grayi]|uniref:Uncharacterized protein n=1 Tax=Listeria grayi TaxID=1641 RepID=A0A378M9L1_LISGR|nr:Uncharacterised protein [Listeria grayi]
MGLGVTNRYTAEEEDSFQGLKERMAELKKHLVTNKVEVGTGPLFMGGFRFDKEKLWQRNGTVSVRRLFTCRFIC